MTSSTTPTDRHTADGGGVTGLTGDRAFTNNTTFRASMSADAAGTDALQQFTVTGWYNTAALPAPGAAPRILDNATTNAGYYLMRKDTGSLELAVGSGGTTSTLICTTTGFSTVGSWVFFAVTYNGAATINNVLMYSGSVSSTAVVGTTGTINRGTPADDTAVFTVGNRADTQRGFNGTLDDIRLYSGILDASQIEAVRLEVATSAIPEPSSAALLMGAGAVAFVALRRKRRVA
jgi:hypothetical protein